MPNEVPLPRERASCPKAVLYIKPPNADPFAETLFKKFLKSFETESISLKRPKSPIPFFAFWNI